MRQFAPRVCPFETEAGELPLETEPGELPEQKEKCSKTGLPKSPLTGNKFPAGRLVPLPIDRRVHPGVPRQRPDGQGLEARALTVRRSGPWRNRERRMRASVMPMSAARAGRKSMRALRPSLAREDHGSFLNRSVNRTLILLRVYESRYKYGYKIWRRIATLNRP